LNRRELLQRLETESAFDVVVLGGGVNGACLYDSLCRQGYRVLLADKGDFASGTSQSSGMMIWGGFLYLRNLDFPTVFKLSRDRDRIVHDKARWVTSETMRYLPSSGLGRARWWVQSGLWLYWLIGMGRRRTPGWEASFSELELIKPGFVKGSLTFEEAVLDQSDARFVYRWLACHRSPGQTALNYCNVTGAYNGVDKLWHLALKDDIAGSHYPIRSKIIVNCTGVWADQVNASFGIDSPFRHVFSKGVYLGIPRAKQHRSYLFFDLGERDDVISLVPWGPISLWGPTETAVKDISDGAEASNGDVDFLLEHYSRRFRDPITRRDIISLRCGLRPLVVGSRYQRERYPLDVSRRQEVFADTRQPWISCYGGKITGCTRMASRVMKLIGKAVNPTGEVRTAYELLQPEVEQMAFPGLSEPVASVAWATEHESARTLEDYLRRRTNIAQWIPRGGLGRNDCNASFLKDIALNIADGDTALAERSFESYREKVKNDFDFLLADSRYEAGPRS
jgi:glycerol-3-phosphate dehydrogenase